MSRNIKSNLKNPQNKLFLKTTYNPHSNKRNECNLSPYHMKNNSNMTTDYLSFYTNESTNKSSKKIGCGKINYFYKNYRMNSLNKNKERYTQTQTQTQAQSKQISRNNSKKNDLLFIKSNLKKSFSISKSNCNSLMISKQIKKQEKKSNKIYKLLLKEVEKSNKNKKSNKKIKNTNKFKKNKSSNHILINHENKFLNSINIINIKTKNNNTNIMKSEYNTKNFNYNNNIEEKIFNHTSKNKSKNKNLSLTLNYNDKNNNPNKISNKLIYTNIINTHKQKSKNKKINISTFHKTCINTPLETFRKKEQIINLTKEIETKQNEIINLQSIVKEKDTYIKNLEEKISSLNITQNVDKEYEKYSKIIIVKNIKNLTLENEQLHKQVLEYKNKETKMLKLLQNMKKSGIDIDNILSQVNSDEKKNINLNSNLNSINSNYTELNSNSNNKYDDIALKTDTTNNTNITNNTFLPLNLNEEQKNISHKSCINLERNLPELPLKNINEYFNENYFSNQNGNANGNIQIQITNNYDCNILQDN